MENDYELLYMIEDDSKEALEILVKKYEPLIYTRLIKFRIKKEYFIDCSKLIFKRLVFSAYNLLIKGNITAV